MATHDIKSYKEALVVIPHVNTILKIFELSYKTLYPFRNFIPVAKVLLVIKDQKTIMDSYKAKFQKIKDSKGLK